MLRRRIEKLEAHLPVPIGNLMERLDRQALNRLSARDRQLFNEMVEVTGRRPRAWSPEHHAAETAYLEAYGMLLREVSDGELNSVIARIERELGRPIPECEALS